MATVVTTDARTQLKKLVKVREELTEFFNRVSKVFSTEEVIRDLMVKRKYNREEMYNTLKEVGLFKCDYISELRMVDHNVTDEQLKLWGIMTESGDYILSGRYVVPIRDINNKVTALVGWYPDQRKYITTPTFGFSKDAQFFNIECYKDCIENHNGIVYLVEGIFDTLALRSQGLSAIGNMGLEMSIIKTQILNRYRKVIAIHDNDNAGRKTSPFTNKGVGKNAKFIWKIETEHVFVDLPNGVKDVDDFIVLYECKEDLEGCADKSLLVKLKDDD